MSRKLSVVQDTVGPAAAPAASGAPGRVLVVDDDALIALMLARMLTDAGHAVETALDGAGALRRLAARGFDAVVADVNMPGLDGLGLLRALRARGDDVPVLLITGTPALSSAILAVDHGAQKYLVKPVQPQVLAGAVAEAIRLHRSADPACAPIDLARRSERGCDLDELEARFARALEGAYAAFQPIVRVGPRAVHAYEALVRTREPSLAMPLELLDAAERLQHVHALGRAVRARVAAAAAACPDDALLFVNLHPYDLDDADLYDPDAPLTRIAGRVVLEITERHSFAALPDVRRRAARLRELGFRIAIDDLGAGYAGLPSLTVLEPEVVKIDMTLTRAVHERPRQQIVVRCILQLGAELGADVIAEGVETTAERDALRALGCDLMQGYLFARPAEGFAAPTW